MSLRIGTLTDNPVLKKWTIWNRKEGRKRRKKERKKERKEAKERRKKEEKKKEKERERKKEREKEKVSLWTGGASRAVSLFRWQM